MSLDLSGQAKELFQLFRRQALVAAPGDEFIVSPLAQIYAALA